MTYARPSAKILFPPRPLRSLLLHFSAACFIGVLATDIAYWMTAEMTWADFSAWLLAAGLLVGGLAGIAGIIDIATGRLPLRQGVGWLYVLGNIAAFAIALFNALIHSRDAWTSVVPTGMTLSAVVVVLMVINAVLGRIVQRQRFEVLTP